MPEGLLVHTDLFVRFVFFFARDIQAPL